MHLPQFYWFLGLFSSVFQRTKQDLSMAGGNTDNHFAICIADYIYVMWCHWSIHTSKPRNHRLWYPICGIQQGSYLEMGPCYLGGCTILIAGCTSIYSSKGWRVATWIIILQFALRTIFMWCDVTEASIHLSPRTTGFDTPSLEFSKAHIWRWDHST